MRDLALREAIRAAGSVTALAAAIGVTRQAVAQWRSVPPKKCRAVARVTGLTLRKLRPDIYW